MRNVRLLTYPLAELMDVAGPLEVFAITSECVPLLGVDIATPCYEVEVVSRSGGPVTTSAGISIETAVADIRDTDTLLIPGASRPNLPLGDQAMIDWIVTQAARARRVGAIGSGSLVLAKTGLLAERRVTTHWAYVEEMAREFPDIRVAADAVYAVDGPFWTCAGVLAGVDMAMAMVEADLGRRIADYVARRMVAKSRRTLGEAQFSVQLQAQEAEIGRIRKLMEWIADNPGEDLSVGALAQRAALSRRSLQRHFKRETKLTPAEFVERARVHEARRLIARTDQSLDHVAAATGFGSLIAMRRAFLRSVGLTPSQYRRNVAPEQVRSDAI